jgi:thioredoxin reductase
MKENIE